jgi:hypothetical protein
VKQPLTQRFRDLYALGKPWPSWVRFLWLGLLVWLEEKYLDALTEQRVTEAVSDWHREEEKLHPTVSWRDVEVEIKPSEVPGLPEMRIRAPWVDDAERPLEGP